MQGGILLILGVSSTLLKGEVMASGNWFSGYGAETQQLPLYNPQQQQGFAQLLQQALQQMQNNPTDFNQIRQNANKNFNETTVPSILNRLSSMGTGGSLQSSYTGQALGSAASDLNSNLGALESQHNLQRGGQLQGMLNMGLTPQFENLHSPQSTGFAGALAPGIGKGIGKGLASGAQEIPWGNIWEGVKEGGRAIGGPAVGLGLAGIGGLAALIHYLTSNRGR